jgi:hypothetical protein
VGIPALLTLVGLLLGSTALLDALTHGWYRYYVFSELAGQGWAPPVLARFWTADIVGREWPAVALVLVAAVAALTRVRPLSALRSPAAYHVATAGGLVGAAWLSRLHTGGYANVLIPAYAAVALLAGLTLAQALRCHRSRVLAPAAAATLALQLVLLAYPLGAQIPTAADRAAGSELLAALRALPGDVLVLRHPWYATELGKGSFAQSEAITDVLRSAADRGRRALEASLPRTFEHSHIRAVVLDGTYDARTLEPRLQREFHLAADPITPTPLYPLTDVRTAPTLLYLRRRNAAWPVATARARGSGPRRRQCPRPRCPAVVRAD